MVNETTTSTAGEGEAPQSRPVDLSDPSVYGDQESSEPIDVPKITQETKKFRRKKMLINFVLTSIASALAIYAFREQLKPFLPAFLSATNAIATEPASNQEIQEMATEILKETPTPLPYIHLPPSTPTPSPTPKLATLTPELPSSEIPIESLTPTLIKSLEELQYEQGKELNIVNDVATEAHVIYIDGMMVIKARPQNFRDRKNESPNKTAGEYLRVSPDNNIEGEDPLYSVGRTVEIDGENWYIHVIPLKKLDTVKNGQYERSEATKWLVNTDELNLYFAGEVDPSTGYWLVLDSDSSPVDLDDPKQKTQLLKFFFYKKVNTQSTLPWQDPKTALAHMLDQQRQPWQRASRKGV